MADLFGSVRYRTVVVTVVTDNSKMRKHSYDNRGYFRAMNRVNYFCLVQKFLFVEISNFIVALVFITVSCTQEENFIE